MTNTDQIIESQPVPGQRYRKRVLILVGILSVISIAFLIDQAGEQRWVLTALGYRDETKLDRREALRYLTEKTLPLAARGDPSAKDKGTVTLKRDEIRQLRLRPGTDPSRTNATFSVWTDGSWYEFEVVMPTELPTDEWFFCNPTILRVTKQ